MSILHMSHIKLMLMALCYVTLFLDHTYMCTAYRPKKQNEAHARAHTLTHTQSSSSSLSSSSSSSSSPSSSHEPSSFEQMKEMLLMEVSSQARAESLYKVDTTRVSLLELKRIKSSAPWWVKYGHDLYTPSDSSDNAIDNYYLIRGKLAEDDPLKTRKVGGLHGYHIVHIDKHNDKMLHYLKSFNFRALVNEEELLVDYDDHGEAAATSISKQQVEEIISGVSSEAWLQHLTELVSFGSRNIFDDRINQSVDYLIGKFQQYGYKPKVESCHDAVELQTMAGGKTFVAKNVYAYKEGSKYPDEFIVMGAHYDDMPDNHQSAPGADDNGSGVSTLLEVARVLRHVDCPRSIYLVAYGAEEEGMIGSARFVRDVVLPNKHNYKGGVALDQVGYTTTPNRPVIVAESKPSENMMIDTVAHAAKKYTNLGVLVNHNPFGSDHMSYLNQGLPSILLIEREDESYPGYHASSDKLENENVPFGTSIAKLTVALALELSHPANDNDNRNNKYTESNNVHSSDNRAASENVQDKGEKKEINRQDKHQIDFSVDPDDFDEIDKGKIDHHSQKVLGGSDDDNDDGGQDKNENGSLITKRHKIRHNEGTVEGGNSDDNSHHRKQTVHNHRRHHHNNDDNDNAAHYSASTPQDEANRILRENEKTINEIDQMAIDAARA